MSFVLVILSFVITAGCSPADTTANQESGAQKVAVYDGGEITKPEVQEQLDIFAQQMGGGEISPDSPQYEAALQQVMPQLITLEMAKTYAQEHDITVSDKELDKAVNDQLDVIKDQVAQQAQAQGQDISREDAFKQALGQANLTEEKLKSDMREQIPDSLILQEVQNKVVSDVEVSDEEVKSYYEKNKDDQFTNPERRCVRHILFNKDQKDKAEEVEKKLEDGGNFGDLAKEYSQDPGSADKGGDIGCIGKGDTVPEFEDAVFEAKTDEIVGPVESDFGYHVIKVTEIKKKEQVPFDEVKGKIQSQLLDEKKQQEFEEWVEDQKKQRDIKYLSPEYKPPAATSSSSSSAAPSATSSASPSASAQSQ